LYLFVFFFFFFSSRRRHTRCLSDWSSDVCSSDLGIVKCDMIAAGILGALKKVKLEVPLVVRLEGTNVEAGRALLAKSGVKLLQRSEERRVGKECRSRWWAGC